MDRGRALAFVTPELVADEPHFRYNVLECLALLLASWRDRTPVHAGAVAHAGRAALLVGPSTIGKSTLCYACVRAGFGLLAEDVVYVSLRMRCGYGATPGASTCCRMHAALSRAVRVPAQIQANGKRKLTVDLAALGADRCAATLRARLFAWCGASRPRQHAHADRPAVAIAALSQISKPASISCPCRRGSRGAGGGRRVPARCGVGA